MLLLWYQGGSRLNDGRVGKRRANKYPVDLSTGFQEAVIGTDHFLQANEGYMQLSPAERNFHRHGEAD